ncbi:MAG: sugar transferase [Lachnospiraceae bacterium]|nr:sugar transferase [Lachnospiraceae bacterium]
MIRKFQNSIISVMKILMYAAAFATFFLMFSIDNREIIALSRTAAVTLSTYVIILFLLSGTYGSFDVGKKKDKDILFSLMISGVLTDLITYFELTIMKTNEANNTRFKLENIGILVSVILIQFVIYLVFVKLGSGFYFKLNSAEKCLIIADDVSSAGCVERALNDFSKRYMVTEVVEYKAPDLKERIVGADTVVLYDVPVDVRKEVIDWCYQNLKNIYFTPNVADIIEHSSQQTVIDDIPFYTWQFHLISFEQRILKRLTDLIVSVILLILTSPVLLVSAVCIKRNDGGKVLFKQKRATANGRVFEIYKFRTMKENVENRSVKKDDERITSVGKVLRRYRIDELPQLINIVKGDMSLVGPRPEMLENVEDYTRELPEFRYRLRMKAGLTGYAQIFGKYNTSSKDKLMLDLMYIENYTFFTDIRLLFQTVLVLFKAEESTEAFGER